MKVLFVLMLVYILSGCWQVVNEADIRRASVVCGSIHRIEQITAHFIGIEEVKCQDKPVELLDD